MPLGPTVHSSSKRVSLPGIGRATSVFRLHPRLYSVCISTSAVNKFHSSHPAIYFNSTINVYKRYSLWYFLKRTFKNVMYCLRGGGIHRGFQSHDIRQLECRAVKMPEMGQLPGTTGR